MKYQNKKNKFSGFTMIELLVVISILGLIASAILFSFTITRAKSRDATRKQAVSEIKKGLELYYQTNGSFPATGGTNPVAITTLAPQLVPAFLSSLYNDPKCSSGAPTCNYLYLPTSASNPTGYSMFVPFERIAPCRVTSFNASNNFSPAVPTCNYND